MSIRPDMPNTIRLKIKENTKVNRKEILNALKDQFNNVKDVDCISQVYNNKTWFITFKEDYNIQEIVNKRLSIESQDILIQDANNIVEFEYAIYTVGWLPHGTDKNVAKQFIEDKLKILNDFSTESVQDEYYKDKDQPDFDKLLIKTGNFSLE